MVMFSTNSGVETHGMCGVRLGRLALQKGEGEGEGPVSARRLEHCEVAFVGSKTPHLSPLPFSKGRGDRRGTICCALRSLQGQAA